MVKIYHRIKWYCSAGSQTLCVDHITSFPAKLIDNAFTCGIDFTVECEHRFLVVVLGSPLLGGFVVIAIGALFIGATHGNTHAKSGSPLELVQATTMRFSVTGSIDTLWARAMPLASSSTLNHNSLTILNFSIDIGTSSTPPRLLRRDRKCPSPSFSTGSAVRCNAG